MKDGQKDSYMTFFISVVLLDVMQIVTSNDNRALHFHACNNACENTATDAYISCEGALLVNVFPRWPVIKYSDVTVTMHIQQFN